MKAFDVAYEYPGCSARDTIIANSEEEAKEIVTGMTNRKPVKISGIKEVSLERVYIRDLTAGNLLRLIGGANE